MADTCRNLLKVEKFRENIPGRDALHTSPQQGTKRPALVSDLH
jgi:hypothetical protein